MLYFDMLKYNIVTIRDVYNLNKINFRVDYVKI